MNDYSLFKYFLRREISNKYLGNITGLSWVFIQPIITLVIYWFVFGTIFKARIPGTGETGFIIYLAIGFWPWIAFSEAVINSITVLEKNKDLIGKIKMDYKIQVFATITATFILNLIGYVVVLLGLFIFAEHFNYARIALLVFPLLLMYLFAIALGLFLSAIQVFIKDTQQLFSTLITLWFFLTPIIYSESVLPERFKSIIQFNPMYTPITFIHKALMTSQPLPWVNMFILTTVTAVLIYLSVKLFNKLSSSFEEYL